jgi:beta-barrel assembly-enhancing protease
MKTKALSFLVVLLFAGSNAFGQFDFSKLTKIVDTAKDATKLVKNTAGIGPEEEATIGDTVALEIIGKYGGLVRDDAIMKRVNLVGGVLVRYSDRPDRNWRFAVLDSDSINAFSAPDGYVFITRGLYDLATTDDMLAGILGHEISHITRRHALGIVERQESGSAAKSLLINNSRQAQMVNSTVEQVDAQLRQFDLSIGNLAKSIMESGFDAPKEFDADKYGRNLAVTAGYAPGGLRGALLVLQAKVGDSKKAFSTHPPLKERLKKLPEDPAPKS